MGKAAAARPGARFSHRVRSVVANTLLIGFLATLAWVFWPSTLGGCSTLTIVSGQSMEPTYSAGDLVWARCGTYDVGDVVIYRPLEDTNAQVIHRIIGGSAVEGWQVQGDNNDFIDPWQPAEEQIMGRALLHIPNVGNLIYFVANPFVWLSVFVLAGGLLLWPSKAARHAKQSAQSDVVETPEEGEAATRPPADTDDDLIFSDNLGG